MAEVAILEPSLAPMRAFDIKEVMNFRTVMCEGSNVPNSRVCAVSRYGRGNVGVGAVKDGVKGVMIWSGRSCRPMLNVSLKVPL